MTKFKYISLIFLLFFNFIFSQNDCNEIITINQDETIIFNDESLLLIPLSSNFENSVSSFQFNLIFTNEFLTFQNNLVDSINNSIFYSVNNIQPAVASVTEGGVFSSNVYQLDNEYSILSIAYATSQLENSEEILLYIPFLLSNQNTCIDLIFSDGFLNNEYIFPNQNIEFLLNDNDISNCVFDTTICLSCLDINENNICDSDEIIGCTDPLACNYVPEANVDDDSCLIEGSSCFVVVDQNCCCCGVCNCVCEQEIIYPLACEFEVSDDAFTTNNIVIQGEIEDCECVTEIVTGCTDATACNYNIYATQDDGSCYFSSECGDCESTGTSQTINLNSGWSLFSTYICPYQPNLELIMSDLITNNDLIILKDGDGSVFWPEFEINNIGNIENGRAYLIKTQNQSTLDIYGTMIDYSYPIEIIEGWSYLGYLNQECYSVVEMMEPIINDLMILKNSDGFVYWPMFEVNSIGNMCPGEGFQINVNNSITFSYQIGSMGTRIGSSKTDKLVNFEEPTNTGNNMIIGLPLNAWESTPSVGDEIAAYNEDGRLIGSTLYEGNNLALTVWGDDITTNEKDGLVEGEKIIFRLWNSQTGVEQALEVRWSEGVGFYTTDGISIAGQIILGSEIAIDKKLVKITDVLGRDINGVEKDVMLLYIYDDGSIERVFLKQ